MFPDFKNSFPKNSFWHFDLHFVLKTFIWDIFQITEKKQQTKNNSFLMNIWRNNWRFNIWRHKRTLLMYHEWQLSFKIYSISDATSERIWPHCVSWGPTVTNFHLTTTIFCTTLLLKMKTQRYSFIVLIQNRKLLRVIFN